MHICSLVTQELRFYVCTWVRMVVGNARKQNDSATRHYNEPTRLYAQPISGSIGTLLTSIATYRNGDNIQIADGFAGGSAGLFFHFF